MVSDVSKYGFTLAVCTVWTLFCCICFRTKQWCCQAIAMEGSKLCELPPSPNFHSGVVFKNILYVLSPLRGSSTSNSCSYCINLDTNQLEFTKHPPNSQLDIFGHTALTITEAGLLLVLGGFSWSTNHAISTAAVFNVNTNQWNSVNCTGDFEHIYFHLSVSWRSNIFVIGGIIDSRENCTTGRFWKCSLSGPSDQLSLLPDDILMNTIRWLAFKDLISISRVNKRFYQFCQNETTLACIARSHHLELPESLPADVVERSRHIRQLLLALTTPDYCKWLPVSNFFLREHPKYKMHDVRVMVFGSKEVGKSTLCVRFFHGIFVEKKDLDLYDGLYKMFPIDELFIRLNVIDMEDTEQYAALYSLYMKSSQAFILCYNAEVPETLNYLHDTIKKIEENQGRKSVPMVLCACRCDSVESREVSTAAGLHFAYDHSIPFLETSSKNNINVEAVFLQAIRCYLNTQMAQRFIPREEWFRFVTGLSEVEFRSSLQQANQPPDPPIFSVCGAAEQASVLLHPRNGTELGATHGDGAWNCGHLKVLQLSELEHTVGTAVRPVADSPTKTSDPPLFVVVTTADKCQESLAYVDVAALQANPANRGALFQVASNFNAVEGTSEDVSPTSPNFVEEYIYDRTQGPAASISAAPAGIARVYAAFASNSTPISEWAQTESRQINLLDNPDIAQHLPTQNGYVVIPPPQPDSPAFPQPQSPEFLSLLSKCKVALHQNVRVVFGSSTNPNGLPVISDSTQCVDQVFCAAVNISQGYSGRMNGRSTNIEEKCKLALRCAFDGAYLCAIAEGKTQLFLCLIGAGAFGNPLDWVWEAMISAHLRWSSHPNSKLKTVWLPLFSSGSFVRGLIVQDLLDKQVPFEWRVVTNGTTALQAHYP
ncbi:ADP ribosylation factor [Pelomyxa schiedti]|nr:ADP ribosylation factor [Pelomyxa schiedti]